MCGLAGFLDTAAQQLSDELWEKTRRMIDALAHRGPDDDGVWTDATAGVALGHRRLSVLDLSPGGHQPMMSACGRYVIAFNGEIYNYRRLKEELETCEGAPSWTGHSDTEVLLAAISFWGLEAAVKRARGMFAIALWDRRDRVLHLVRDRMGEKPLYYGWVGRTFLFGSELKALRAYTPWQPDIDRRAVALFLRSNYIPGPYSIYKGIVKLQPGSILTVRRGGETISHSYWSLADTVQAGKKKCFTGNEHDAAAQFDRLLRDVIREQMAADVPLGAFLSGGIDSSTVVALMQAQSARPVQTFAIGFWEKAYDEAPHARAVAQHLGTDHTELYVTPADALAVIPKLPTLFDEPFSDASQIPTYLVAELARRSVTVTLSGDGGDELFAGYNRYFLARSIWRSIGWMPTGLRLQIARMLYALPALASDRWLEKAQCVFPKSARVKRPAEGLRKLAHILRSETPAAMYNRLIAHWEEPHTIVRDVATPLEPLTNRAEWSVRRDYTEQMMYLDAVTYLPDDILVKVDRASMGASLESRVPMLDSRVVEFAWSLPLSMKIKRGRGKRVLRQVLKQYVPQHLIDRPKMGFGIPIDSWLRGPLKEWAAALLDPRRLEVEGLLRPEPIRRKWEEHMSGRHNWQYLLWDVLMFQAWLEAQKAQQTQPVHFDGRAIPRSIHR